MNKMKDELKILEKDDIYSMSMFMLYKLIDDPEYCAMGELPYILDRKNLLNFCTYFGGRTIKIPTIDEIYSIMHAVLLYQYVHVDGMTFENAITQVGYGKQDIRKVRKIYNKLSKVLDEYEFKHR